MPAPRSPICRFPGCHRPATADRRGYVRYCSPVHFRVHSVAVAVARRETPPRGRDHARDAVDALRLVNVAADVGPGELLDEGDYRSLVELFNAYRRRSGPRESNARPR